jgi:hypothetical protein
MQPGAHHTRATRVVRRRRHGDQRRRPPEQLGQPSLHTLDVWVRAREQSEQHEPTKGQKHALSALAAAPATPAGCTSNDGVASPSLTISNVIAAVVQQRSATARPVRAVDDTSGSYYGGGQ